MATKTIIKPAKSPAAVGPYNHAVRVGDLMFCAGQIPIDPKNGNLVAGDIKVQTERVLQNVKAILDDQKLTFAHVVKCTVFMTNLADFAGMNEIYSKCTWSNEVSMGKTQGANRMLRRVSADTVHGFMLLR